MKDVEGEVKKKRKRNCCKTDNNEGRHPIVSWDQLRSSSHILDHLCLLAKTTAACGMRQFYFQTLSAILLCAGHSGCPSLGFRHPRWETSVDGARGWEWCWGYRRDWEESSSCSCTLTDLQIAFCLKNALAGRERAWTSWTERRCKADIKAMTTEDAQ